MGKQSFQIRYIYNPLPDQYFQDPLVDNYCSKVTFNGRSYLLELHGIFRQVGELHVLFKLFMQNAQFKRRIVIKEIKRKECLHYILFIVPLCKCEYFFIREKYKRLRLLNYQSTDVFILCYSIGNRSSCENIRKIWHAVIRRHCPAAKMLLVACKIGDMILNCLYQLAKHLDKLNAIK